MIISDSDLQLMENFFIFFVHQLQRRSQLFEKLALKACPLSVSLRSFMMAEYSHAQSSEENPLYDRPRYDPSQWKIMIVKTPDVESKLLRARIVAPPLQPHRRLEDSDEAVSLKRRKLQKSRSKVSPPSVIDLTQESQLIKNRHEPAETRTIQTSVSCDVIANQDKTYELDLQEAIRRSLQGKRRSRE